MFTAFLIDLFQNDITPPAPESCGCPAPGLTHQLWMLATGLDEAEVDRGGDCDRIHAPAEVAELADALRSGRSEGNLMWVQVPPSAHNDPGSKFPQHAKTWSTRGTSGREIPLLGRVR